MSDRLEEFLEELLTREGGYVNDPAAISEAIRHALLARSAALARDPAPPERRRPYVCEVPHCPRHGYANGLCNAHYLRKRKGWAMDAPIKNRKRASVCALCDAPTGGRGGWGLCPRHYKRERLATIKGAAVALLGGCCADCGESFPLAVYDFHHIGAKDASVSELMSNASPEEIAAEVSKCVLLCANCHRVRHSDVG